jgi:NAD(P)-dependent dehydrogenase (short-subunit alcohol dehydrogenase family)
MTTFVVTGANRGIGLALAGRLAARGDRVIATARDPKAATALDALGAKVTVHALDVTDESAVAALANALVGEPVDAVIANAGVLNSYARIDSGEHDAAAWARVLMTNVAGPYFLARAFLPALARSKGKFVAISSSMASSQDAAGGAYPYRASKAGVTNLMRNLAVDLKPHGIAVAAIDPGWVKTAMGGASAPLTPEESAQGIVERIDRLSLATTGVFETYRGRPVAF